MRKYSLVFLLVFLVFSNSSVYAQPVYQWNGNYGIGTSTPSRFFEVKNSVVAGLGPVLRLTGGGDNNAQCAIEMATFDPGLNPANFRIIATDVGGYGSRVEIQNKSQGLITDQLQTRLTIADNGFIGIGTNSPATKLQVNGGHVAAAANDQLSAFTQLWADNAVIWKSGSAATGLRFGSATDLNAANWSEKMRIMDNGAVCIGTILNTAADYKLFVETGIRTRKVKVDASNWADYVFLANYRLRPLSELEQYIKQHGHLPEVPSEDEVNKEGIDLGNNQAVLLIKIEELTLYVIEQNKRQENQEKLIQKQQERLAELEKQLKEKVSK